MEEGIPLSFKPGQYLEIIHSDNERSAFSIAQCPRQDAEIELQILRDPNQGTSVAVLSYLQNHSMVQITAPQGSCTLDNTSDDQPIIIGAASTGFAQAKSLLEGAFTAQLPQPIRLYWGVRQARDYYQLEMIDRWRQQWPQFDCIQVVAEDSTWAGRSGLLNQVLLEDLPQWRDCHLYLSGSPAMVYACVDLLAENQLFNHGNTYSDVFTYAPRTEK